MKVTCNDTALKNYYSHNKLFTPHCAEEFQLALEVGKKLGTLEFKVTGKVSLASNLKSCDMACVYKDS